MITIDEVADMMMEYRIKNNLNQKQLAEKIGMSNKTLCNIETRKKTIKQITLKKVVMKLQDSNF